MINAAIVGLGRWGQNLVNSVQGKSDKIRFTTGVLRHPENAREYAEQQGLTLHERPRQGARRSRDRRDRARDAAHGARRADPRRGESRQARVHREAVHADVAAMRAQALQACARRARSRSAWASTGASSRRSRRSAGCSTTAGSGALLHIEGNFCGPSVYRFPQAHWRQSRDEGPAGGMTGRGVHVVDAMLYLAGQVETVQAQSYRIALDYGIDDTTSMLFRFRSGATGYLGTIIATAETWRMQVFGSKGWVEVGDVEHLTTWQMRVCFVDPENLTTHAAAAGRHVPGGEHRARRARELRRRGARRPRRSPSRAATRSTASRCSRRSLESAKTRTRGDHRTAQRAREAAAEAARARARKRREGSARRRARPAKNRRRRSS